MPSSACSKGETSARWWSSWLDPPRLHARTHCQYRGPHCPLRHIYGGLRVRRVPPRRFGERATCFAPCAAGKLLRRRWRPGEYAGHLRTDDPLHGYLSHHVLPRMGVTAQQVDFRVFWLKETKVYLSKKTVRLQTFATSASRAIRVLAWRSPRPARVDGQISTIPAPRTWVRCVMAVT